MSIRLSRWVRSGWGSTLLLAATVFCLLTVVPIMPWQARCYEEPVPGPYQPIFLDEVTAWLSQTDVYYWRINNIILLRILPLFDGHDIITRGTTLLNIQKISDMLADEVTIDGVLYPKPPAVRRLEQQPLGTYDGIDLCTAAIRPSPADPPLRQASSQP